MAARDSPRGRRREAAKAMAAGEAAEIYDPARFREWLFQIAPPKETWGLTWQYPPTYFFAIALLALLPYGFGYAVWTGTGAAIFAAAARGAVVSASRVRVARAVGAAGAGCARLCSMLTRR